MGNFLAEWDMRKTFFLMEGLQLWRNGQRFGGMGQDFAKTLVHLAKKKCMPYNWAGFLAFMDTDASNMRAKYDNIYNVPVSWQSHWITAY